MTVYYDSRSTIVAEFIFPAKPLVLCIFAFICRCTIELNALTILNQQLIKLSKVFLWFAMTVDCDIRSNIIAALNLLVTWSI